MSNSNDLSRLKLDAEKIRVQSILITKANYKEQAKAQNNINNIINLVHVAGVELLSKGFKRKDSGALYKSDFEALKGVINSIKSNAGNGARVDSYIDDGEYSIRVNVKTSFKVLKVDGSYSHHTTLSQDLYLWDHQGNKPFSFSNLDVNMSAAKYIKASAKAKALDSKIRELNSELSKLNRYLAKN